MTDGWQALERKTIFKAPPWLEVSVESLKTPEGRLIRDYYRVDLPDFVVVFAETPDNRVLTLHQIKRAVGHISLTLPGGMVDPGESPLAAAQRELREETGFKADGWMLLGHYVVNGNQGCGTGYFFKAKNAVRSGPADANDLEAMELRLSSKKDLAKAVSDGRVALINHAAAISLAMLDDAERQRA